MGTPPLRRVLRETQKIKTLIEKHQRFSEAMSTGNYTDALDESFSSKQIKKYDEEQRTQFFIAAVRQNKVDLVCGIIEDSGKIPLGLSSLESDAFTLDFANKVKTSLDKSDLPPEQKTEQWKSFIEACRLTQRKIDIREAISRISRDSTSSVGAVSSSKRTTRIVNPPRSIL